MGLMKICKDCSKEFSDDYFSKRSLVCRNCTNVKARLRYRQNLEDCRARNRRSSAKYYANLTDIKKKELADKHKDYYHRHKEYWQTKYKRPWRDKSREDRQAYVQDYLSDKQCVDCGEADPIVLEFDHLDQSTKIAAIAFLAIRGPFEVLVDEIQKCEVVCANCHKKRTAKQLNWKKQEHLK